MTLREKLQSLIRGATRTTEGVEDDIEEQCNKQFAHLEKTEIDQLYSTQLGIYRDTSEIPVKRFLLTYWKTRLTSIEEEERSGWSQLNEETQKLYVNTLISLFQEESEETLQEELGIVIARVLIQYEQAKEEEEDADKVSKELNQLYKFIKILANAKSDSKMSLLSLIIAEIFRNDYSPTGIKTKEILDWVRIGFQSISIKTQLNSIHALLALVLSENPDLPKEVSQLLPVAFKKLHELIQTDKGFDREITRIFALYPNLPHLIQDQFLIDTMGTIFEFLKQNETRGEPFILQSLKVTEELAESFCLPERAGKIGLKFIETHVDLFCSIVEDEIEYFPAPEGSLAEEEIGETNPLEKAVLKSMRAFVGAVGSLTLIEMMMWIMGKKMDISDEQWKMKYLAVEVLSALLPSQEAKPSYLLSTLLDNFLSDKHPKVICAIFNHIRKSCDDCGDELEEQILDAFFKVTSLILQFESKRSQIVSLGLLALSSLFKTEFIRSRYKDYCGTVMTKLVFPALKGVLIQKEAAIAFLGDMAQCFQDQECSPVNEVFDIYLSFLSNKQDPVHEDLSSATIAAATNWIAQFPAAKKFAEPVIEALIETFNKIDKETSSTVTLSVFKAISNLAQVDEEILGKCFSKIFPKLITLCGDLIKQANDQKGITGSILQKMEDDNHLYQPAIEEEDEGEEEGESEAEYEIYGFHNEEFMDEERRIACEGLELLCLLFENFPKDMLKHSNSFEQFHQNHLVFVSEPEILARLTDSSYWWLKASKDNLTLGEFLRIFGEIRKLLLNSLSKLHDFSNLIVTDFVDSAGKIYLLSDNFLPPEEASTTIQIFEALMNAVCDSCPNAANEGEAGEDFGLKSETNDKKVQNIGKFVEEKKEVETDPAEYEVLSSLTTTLGNLMKCNRELFVKNFAPNVLSLFQNRHWKTKANNYFYGSRTALIAAHVVLEVFRPGHDAVKPFLENPIMSMLESLPKRDGRLVVDNVGIFAMFAPKEMFTIYSARLLQVLEAIITKEKSYLRDNLAVAYGKILKYQEEMLLNEVISNWLACLPLNDEEDRDDGNEQYELLAELINGPRYENVCGENGSRKQLLKEKMELIKQRTDEMKDKMIRRKIESAYLKLTL